MSTNKQLLISDVILSLAVIAAAIYYYDATEATQSNPALNSTTPIIEPTGRANEETNTATAFPMNNRRGEPVITNNKNIVEPEAATEKDAELLQQVENVGFAALPPLQVDTDLQKNGFFGQRDEGKSVVSWEEAERYLQSISLPKSIDDIERMSPDESKELDRIARNLSFEDQIKLSKILMSELHSAEQPAE